MTLTIVAANGHAAWWMWAIRDEDGALIEESTTQYRSAADAESRGRARIAELERWGPARPGRDYLTDFRSR